MIEVLLLIMTIPADNDMGFIIIEPTFVDYIAECDIQSSHLTIITGCTRVDWRGNISIEFVHGQAFKWNPLFCMTEWEHEWHHAKGLRGHNHPEFQCLNEGKNR
jgi:hypothetical protein